MIYWWQIKMMNPFHSKWKKWKKEYIEKEKKQSFDSYFMICMREGSCFAAERFQVFNPWSRIFTNEIISSIIIEYSHLRMKIRNYLR